MPKETDDSGIDGTYVFDHRQSRKAYHLNKMCMSLTKPENRKLFAQDMGAYMRSYEVPEDQIKAVEEGDWLTLTKVGGNVYMLLKLGHVLGTELYALGAQQRGQTLEEFLESRAAKEAR
jgi:protocatechuate 4,5-dioxygenase alpha chain